MFVKFVGHIEFTCRRQIADLRTGIGANRDVVGEMNNAPPGYSFVGKCPRLHPSIRYRLVGRLVSIQVRVSAKNVHRFADGVGTRMRMGRFS